MLLQPLSSADHKTAVRSQGPEMTVPEVSQFYTTAGVRIEGKHKAAEPGRRGPQLPTSACICHAANGGSAPSGEQNCVCKLLVSNTVAGLVIGKVTNASVSGSSGSSMRRNRG